MSSCGLVGAVMVLLELSMGGARSQSSPDLVRARVRWSVVDLACSMRPALTLRGGNEETDNMMARVLCQEQW